MQPDDVVRIPIGDAIDLHAFAPRDVWAVVEDYLTAARDAGFTEVRLIHGRGKGVQRAGIQRRLGSHPLVARFWDAPDSHLGATIVRLRDADPGP
jgi:dsDNA-specific endonuclease/ATPase MutS2